MNKISFTTLIIGTFFMSMFAQVAYAGPYEDCLNGRPPYTTKGTEESCATLKGFPATSGGGERPDAETTTSGGGERPSNARVGLSYSLENPLAFDSIQSFIIAILNIIIVLATPIVVIFIILAGFKYVTARGNATQVQEATRALTYAIIGGVLIIGAVAIAEIIRDLVSAFGA